MTKELQNMMRLLNGLHIEKCYPTYVKPRFFKGSPLFERYEFLQKPSEICLENTIDNAMRSGSDFFSISSRFWLSWRPFWDLPGPPGRLLGSLGRLLGSSWGSLGRSWHALGRSWEALGTLLDRFWCDLKRSWPLQAVPGRFGLHFGPSEGRF